MMSRKKKQEKNLENGQTPADETLSQEQVESTVETEAEEKQEQELQGMKDKFLRLLAEFENYKKRTFREKLDTMNLAAQETMLAILPVLDDFDRAKQMADDESTDEVFSEGVSLVYNKLHTVLKGKGLEQMETTGQAFDSEWHEAITEIPAATDDQKGFIIDTIEKGYTLNKKIIRHAKVVVGK